ncbi:hypothetical protein FRB97_008524 [Tulasnella sp. 331]|nr:hypothetical protein FRB97_008524 [Tulasnella sp. 331]KAG8888299.1 hypothetical protein FRB98_008045 [Tulasnella sp. 332]
MDGIHDIYTHLLETFGAPTSTASPSFDGDSQFCLPPQLATLLDAPDCGEVSFERDFPDSSGLVETRRYTVAQYNSQLTGSQLDDSPPLLSPSSLWSSHGYSGENNYPLSPSPLPEALENRPAISGGSFPTTFSQQASSPSLFGNMRRDLRHTPSVTPPSSFPAVDAVTVEGDPAGSRECSTLTRTRESVIQGGRSFARKPPPSRYRRSNRLATRLSATTTVVNQDILLNLSTSRQGSPVTSRVGLDRQPQYRQRGVECEPYAEDDEPDGSSGSEYGSVSRRKRKGRAIRPPRRVAEIWGRILKAAVGDKRKGIREDDTFSVVPSPSAPSPVSSGLTHQSPAKWKTGVTASPYTCGYVRECDRFVCEARFVGKYEPKRHMKEDHAVYESNKIHSGEMDVRDAVAYVAEFARQAALEPVQTKSGDVKRDALNVERNVTLRDQARVMQRRLAAWSSGPLDFTGLELFEETARHCAASYRHFFCFFCLDRGIWTETGTTRKMKRHLMDRHGIAYGTARWYGTGNLREALGENDGDDNCL